MGHKKDAMLQYDVLILGAGASGLVCAAQCAGRGRRTLVLDRADRTARKVRASGGGRCNATNLAAGPGDYRGANPHFCKSALARFTPWDTLELLRAGGLTPVEEADGRIFCAQGAPAVARALEAEARRAGAELRLGCAVHGAARSGDGFEVAAEGGPYRAASLVIALGGPAWPRLGGSDLGHRLARAFGLAVTEVRPGLAPLPAPAAEAEFCRSLSGVSLPVRLFGEGGDRSAEGSEGDLLFTHSGISGPAVLDASLWWRPGRALSLDLLPGAGPVLETALAEAPRRELRTLLAARLPRRLALALCERHGWGGAPAALGPRALADLDRTLHGLAFTPAGPPGWDRAEVTLGGVDTAGLSSKTLEAKGAPGLFLTGEVLDVTGRLGGFNLQWAFASGFAAGQWA
ncbi:MAG: NAD(P)/FAD-dependent oxidoreductase [Desulfovibrionaceae bacterium]